MARRQGRCKLCSKVNQMNCQGKRMEKIARPKGWHIKSVALKCLRGLSSLIEARNGRSNSSHASIYNPV